MWIWPKDSPGCRIVARTIGGPYAVLVAEQMPVCDVRTVIGLASGGRISQALPLPGIAVADEAVCNNGKSLHYMPPQTHPVDGSTQLAYVADTRAVKMRESHHPST